MWEMQDGDGNLFYTRNRPADPNAPPTRNSTLHWLGARCGGLRFPGLVACQAGPLTSVQVKRCTGIPPSLNPTTPRRMIPCSDDICNLCVVNAANQQLALVARTMLNAHQILLCRTCQLYEARRHPDGYSGCICPSLLQGGWMCWSCRDETRKQIGNKDSQQRDWVIKKLHRDRQGRKICDPNRPQRSKPLCPGCAARSFTRPSVLGNHVTYCTSCRGVDVQPSRGPNFVPSRLMPVRPVRRSSRLAARDAEMPPLDFQPIMIPRRPSRPSRARR